MSAIGGRNTHHPDTAVFRLCDPKVTRSLAKLRHALALFERPSDLLSYAWVGVAGMWRKLGGNTSREILRLACIVGAITITYPSLRPELPVSERIALDEFSRKETVALHAFENEQARLIYSWLEDYPDDPPKSDPPKDDLAKTDAPKQDFSYLTFYAYSEVPPKEKPADTVLASLKDIPIGTPIEEIKRASDAFGLDFTFMKTVARIESGFDPKQRTGSYIGLFQLSHYEFAKYGSGDITNPRDNAIAAAYKLATEGILFELDTHKQPTRYDRYLIHQQGTQGAAEHVAHPERIAWKSMCATEEGKEKGESWCKRAIWQNTLPAVKQIWKSVEKLTSAGFVDMWQERLDQLYARYVVASAPLPAVAVTSAIPSPAPAKPQSAAPPSAAPRPSAQASSTAAKKQPNKEAVRVAAKAQHHTQPAHSPSKTVQASKKTPAKISGKSTQRLASHHLRQSPKHMHTAAR
jgi:hypothetical protein